jgi:transglutaminase-like putative cysteine protease
LLLIHSFDLPRKRDILYSITSALIISIVLSVIVFSSWIVIYLFLFGFLMFLTIFVLDSESDDIDWRKYFESFKFVSLLKVSTYLIVFVFFLSFLVFLIYPKPEGGYFWKFVFAPASQYQQFSNSNQSNQSKEINQDKLNEVFSKSYTYKGFRGEMDLFSRGSIPHILIMKVKMPIITYIKGIHLVNFDGKKWYNPQDETLDIQSSDVSYFSLSSDLTVYDYSTISTYFIINEDLPDILYHVPIPYEVFFPSSVLRINNYNYYAEYPLVKGITYTVSSKIIGVDFTNLMRWTFDDYQKFLSTRIFINKDDYFYNYLQLSSNISSEIKKLANDLTFDEFRFWGKVQKIKNYLEKNYTYDLFIGKPSVDDTIYDFLFIKRRGYCEQFSSAMAVMLRSIGIPCRIVLGYLPEEKDFFTGFVNVYSDDAHAWVEVLTPYGWVTVDPSPSNVDEKTLSYLQKQKDISFISNLLGVQRETLGTIQFLIKITVYSILILIFSFIISKVYSWVKIKLLVDYLENIDENSIYSFDKAKIQNVFLKFLNYFSYKNINFEKSLTLRELKNYNIQDPFFDKFRKVIDVLEVISYGPKNNR